MSNNDKSQSHFFKGMPTAFTNVFVGTMSIRHVHIFTWWTSSVAKNAQGKYVCYLFYCNVRMSFRKLQCTNVISINVFFISSLIHVVIRCAVLMISGLVTYHLILSKIWNLEVSVLHLGRGQETSLERCAVPWAANIPVIQSFAAELLGTFILDIGKIYQMMNYI